MIRADNPAEFCDAFERIRDILATPDIVRKHEEQDRFLQVESYIDGEEFALEGLLTNGEFQVIALFDKPDPLTGPYLRRDHLCHAFEGAGIRPGVHYRDDGRALAASA